MKSVLTFGGCSFTHYDNLKSRKLLEKLGFKSTDKVDADYPHNMIYKLKKACMWQRLHSILRFVVNWTIRFSLYFSSHGEYSVPEPAKLECEPRNVEKNGLPSAEFLGGFVGTVEILCGTLILLGLLTRLASIPLIIIMLVAIATTKTEVLADKGFWEMMHGSRTDWSMLLGSVFLLIKGGGYWSVDKRLTEWEQ